MSHTKKATSSCYLGNYCFLRLYFEEKSVYNQKKLSKKLILNIRCKKHPEKSSRWCISTKSTRYLCMG